MTGEIHSYAQAAAYIEEIPKFTKKHSLDHTREFLKRLGDPALDRKIIHVAGTNGKGSVCAYIKAILTAEGKKTGFFTSPHLVSVNERIEICGKPVDDDTFFRIFEEVYKIAGEMEEEGLGHPSYFEFLFGMGMKAFAASDVEYIILETGLGGRLDATNAVPEPFLTVITSISLDHTDILGDTIEKIAGEKAGIIKKGVPVIFDGSNPAASEVIRKKAREAGAPCREISKNAFKIREVQRKYIAFSRTSAYDKDVICRIPICGIYQVMNACIALEAAEYLLCGQAALEGEGPDAERTARWARALEGVRWPGRMEEVRPHLILDGAHNPGAIEAFVDSVQNLKGREMEKDVVIFSAVSDKKYEQMIAYLCRNLDVKAFIVTKIEEGRAVEAEELFRLFQKYTDKKVICRPRIADALREAEKLRKVDGNECPGQEAEDPEGDIYCLGSLYLAGMVKKLLSGGGLDVEF